MGALDPDVDVRVGFWDLAEGTSAARRQALVRRILADVVGVEADELAFSHPARGRPTLRRPFDVLHFSSSHSSSLLAVATSFAHPIGLDVECVVPRRGLGRVASTRFSAVESALIDSAPTGREALTRFYRAWVVREAFVKLRGTGLGGLSGAPRHPKLAAPSSPLRSFAVHAPEHAWFIEGPASLDARFALASGSEIRSYSLSLTLRQDHGDERVAR